MLQSRPNWLPSLGCRPTAVGVWFKTGRNFDKQPDLVDDMDSYVKEWSKWYHGMQPGWRTDLSQDIAANADWSSLAKGGNNGLYVPVLSIGWWIFALHKGDLSAECVAALEDVRWVFDQIGKYLTSKKRLADEDLDGETHPKK